VAISFGKKGFFENLKKNQFSDVGRTVRAFGADGPRVFDIYLMSETFGKSFRENMLPGGQSAYLRRTVRGLPADGPRGPGGRSARPNGQSCQPLTSHFTVGIQTRTVREGIADSPRGTRFAHNG
jgi:hypothetical protein